MTASWELNGKALARQVIGNLLQGSTPVIEWITLDDVQKELAHRPGPADTEALLIENLKCLDGSGSGHYAAWVIRPAGFAPGGATVDETFIDLGPAKPLEDLVANMNGAIAKIVADLLQRIWPPDAPLDTLYDSDPLVVRLRFLSRQLLGKVDRRTWAIHRWYISPAAETWLVPFPALPIKSHAPGRKFTYALERHDISYLISGRDLITLKSSRSAPASKPKRSFVIGAPELGPVRVAEAAPTGRPDIRRAASTLPEPGQVISAARTPRPRTITLASHIQRGRHRGRFLPPPPPIIPPCNPFWPPGQGPGPLPGGLLGSKEGPFAPLGADVLNLTDFIAQYLAPSYWYTADLATEDRFHALSTDPSLNPPKAVAFVTHGFFLGEPYKSKRPSPALKDPLNRCGLALAGVDTNRGLNQGKLLSEAIPDPASPVDGLLTGREIVRAKLKGTELALLVGCETGAGALFQNPNNRRAVGDSVAALRHAFTLAGARAVVATSWDIAPDRAAPLVETFLVERPRQGNAKALWEAQRDQIKRNVHPFHWASFSLTGLED